MNTDEARELVRIARPGQAVPVVQPDARIDGGALPSAATTGTYQPSAVFRLGTAPLNALSSAAMTDGSAG